MDKKLPKGWVETEFGNVISVMTNGGNFKQVDEYHEGYFPISRIETIWNGVIDENKVKYALVKQNELDKYKIQLNDILFSHINSDKHLGKTAIYKNNINLVHGINLLLLRTKKGVNADFTNYYLKYYRNIGRFLDIAQRSVNQSSINQKKLYSIPFLLPPLAEQERIVAKLDTLFAQQERMKKALERIPTLLKNFRQQVLTQAVTGKLINLNKLDKKIISDFFDVRTGATPKKGTAKYYNNPSIPWIKSGEVRNSFIYEVSEFITDVAVKETNAKVFPIDTILIAMYGEGKTRGQVGWMKIEAATNQAIAALVNNDLNLSTRKYIYFYCLSQYNEIRAKAEGGNQPNLNLTKIKNWEISIPKEEFKQQEIVHLVESLFAKADAIEARYQKLKEKIEILPQAILHKAFKGELVAQLPTDGDARDLLEEIRALKASSLKVKKMYKPIEDVISMVAED